MWRRLRLSVRMLNISLRALWHHPEFLLFPLVSAMALVVILVVMSTGALALVDFDFGRLRGSVSGARPGSSLSSTSSPTWWRSSPTRGWSARS